MSLPSLSIARLLLTLVAAVFLLIGLPIDQASAQDAVSATSDCPCEEAPEVSGEDGGCDDGEESPCAGDCSSCACCGSTAQVLSIAVIAAPRAALPLVSRSSSIGPDGRPIAGVPPGVFQPPRARV